jgi:hypothetical protein
MSNEFMNSFKTNNYKLIFGTNETFYRPNDGQVQDTIAYAEIIYCKTYLGSAEKVRKPTFIRRQNEAV